MLSELVLPTHFLVVRHAETVWNLEHRYAGHQEVPLSEHAENQIGHLTHLLIQEPIDCIYSSPLHRCEQTIAATSEILDIPVQVVPELIERNIGNWEGQYAEELAKHYPGLVFPDSAYNGDFEIPGAESLDQLEQRVRRCFTELVIQNPGKTVLVSTHAGVILMLERRIIAERQADVHWPGNSVIFRFTFHNGKFSIG